MPCVVERFACVVRLSDPLIYTRAYGLHIPDVTLFCAPSPTAITSAVPFAGVLRVSGSGFGEVEALGTTAGLTGVLTGDRALDVPSAADGEKRSRWVGVRVY